MTKADFFMGASWLGLAGLFIAALGLIDGLPEALSRAGLLIAVSGGIAMASSRKADEFTLGLWTAGASAAFGVVIVCYLGLPFAEGLYDGITANEQRQDIPASVVPMLAVVAFYLAFFFKRAFGGSQ